MAFSLSPYCKCDYYLSWDADTIPLRRLSFFRDEHPLFSQKQERHIPYFETLFNLLHLKPFNDFSFITEHMVFKSNGYNNIKLHHNNFFRFRCSLINLYKKQSGTLLNSNTKNKLFVKFLATK